MGIAQNPLQQRLSAGLTARHFLSHKEQQLAIGIIDATEQSAKTAQIARLFSRGSPGDIVRRFPLRQVGQLRRFLPVIEELVEGKFHRTRQLFKRLDSRNSVAVLNAGDVAAEETGALFDVTLREFFCFTQQAKPIADYHKGIVAWNDDARKTKPERHLRKQM